MKARFPVALVASLLFLASCSGARETTKYPTRLESAAPPTAQLTGGPSSIDVVARGFSVRDHAPPAGFGYFVYLYFGSRSKSSEALRRQAAEAFLSLFVGTTDPKIQNVSRDRTALFYAPLVSDEVPQTVDALLRQYDYETAQLLTSRIGRALPGVALIGSALPLESTSTNYALEVVDLCGAPQVAEEKILSFRNRLMFEHGVVTDSSFKVMTAMQALFKSLGEFVLTPLSKAPAAAVTCL